MRKKIMVLLLMLAVGTVHASKLSKFFDKMDARQKQRDVQEWQQDMNFADFSFRLQQRYVNNRGEKCRDYEFRGRSNPFRHGFYTVCDQR